jgi:hypothetical protein
MNAPQATPVQVDVGDAFGYVFRSRNWFGKLAVGALCLLFFWLLFIPLFILLGYFVEAARTVSQGGRELPPWTDIGKKLGDGFLLGVALFVWGLPGTILSSGGGGFHCVQSSCSYQAGPLAPLGGLYGLLIALLTAAIWSQFLAGGFGAAFDFRAVFRRALQNPGMTVIVWLVASVLGVIIALAGLIVVGIGILFTLPYAFALSANLYGQFAQRTQSAASAAPAL